MMPYIAPALRFFVHKDIDNLVRHLIEYKHHGQAGQLNYIIARMVSRLLEEQGTSYALLNEMIGALECCKLEIYRRLVVNYEGQKIQENGDVFDENTG